MLASVPFEMFAIRSELGIFVKIEPFLVKADQQASMG